MKHDWRLAALEDVARAVNGGTPKTKVSEYWGGPHLWITPAEMGGLPEPYLRESRRSLTDEGLAHSSASLLPPKSVILSTRAPIGHLVINDEPMAFNQGCRGIVPGEDLHHKFLYYWLVSNVKKLDDLGSGTTFKELAASKLKKFPVPILPLSQQERIVAILDEAFAGIETAIANTEKNLANGQDLFESYSERALKVKAESRRHLLGDCVERVSTGPFGSLLHKSDYVSEGTPLVNPTNILGATIVANNKKRVSQDTLDRLSAYVLRRGDIVVARRGEIGRCAVVEDDQSGWLCGTGCFYLRPVGAVNPHYLAHVIRSRSGRSELERRATGTTMKNLGNKALASFEFHLPPMDEQNQIVEQVADLEESQSQLFGIWTRKLTSLNELKQSLLRKAFSGELTADHAEREVESATV